MQLLVEITAPAFGPSAVGRRDDGKVVMVHGAIPGDLLSVEVVKETAGYVQARIVEIVRPSPYRHTPPCPSHPDCSGCDWMSIEPSAQVKLKQEVLEHALRKVLPHGRPPVHLAARDQALPSVAGSTHAAAFLADGIGPGLSPAPLQAEADLGYRARARLHVEGKRGQPLRVGFFREGTHDLVPISACPVCVPELSLAISRLAAAPSPADFSGTLELVSDDEGRVLAALFLSLPHPHPALLARQVVEVTAPPPCPPTVGRGLSSDGPPAQKWEGTGSIAPGLAGVAVMSPKGQRGDWGIQSSTLTVLPPDCTIPIFPAAFCQANRAVNRMMVEHLVALFQEHAPEADVLELYAGHGNFTFPLARSGRAITAVELGVRRDLLPKRDNVKWIQGDAAAVARQWVKMGRSPGAVVLDPPREGAATIMPLIAQLAPRHVAYVSCDPNTFARDVAMLADSGYSIATLTWLDMMPNTHHMELVGWLRRGTPLPRP